MQPRFKIIIDGVLRMKKIAVGVLVVGAAVFAGIPFMTGIVAETKSKELVEKVNQDSAQYGAIELVEYSRGFRSSTSSYSYKPSEALQKLLKVDSVDYDCNINHGITGVDYECLMANKGAYKEFLDKYLAGKDPLTVSGHISAFGGIDQSILISPLEMNSEQGEKVIIAEPLELTSRFDSSTSGIDYDGSLPSIVFESANGKFDLSDVEMSGDLEKIEGDLYVGDVNMSAKSFKASDQKGQVSFNDLVVDTSTKEKGEDVSSEMSLKAATLEIPNQAGETDTFSDILFDAGMSGMKKDALIEYIKANEEMQKAILAGGAEQNAAAASMTQLIPAAEKLMQKGLGVNLKTSFNSDDVSNSIDFDLNLENSLAFSELMGFLFAPDEMLKNFTGNLKVDLKQELLSKYPILAIGIGSNPLFVQSDKGVTLDVKLDSALTVNGQKTTVAELQSQFR